MQKITVKELVDFSRRSERSKRNFAQRLKTRIPKEKKQEDDNNGGGDYWKSSDSCIINVFKSDDKNLYNIKIADLHSKIAEDGFERTKKMHKSNISILSNFEDFDLSEIKPSSILKYEIIQKHFKILEVKGFPLYINPSILFVFEKDDKQMLGGTWLVSQIRGFKKSELGMFCEMLYRFLINNYGNDYAISKEYCSVVDTYKAQKVLYTELKKGEIPFLIEGTLEEIKAL